MDNVVVRSRLFALVLLLRLPLLLGLLLWMGRGPSFAEGTDALLARVGVRLDWHHAGKVVLYGLTAMRVSTSTLLILLLCMGLALTCHMLARRARRGRLLLITFQYAGLLLFMACLYCDFSLGPEVLAILGVDVAVLIHLNSDMFRATGGQICSDRLLAWLVLAFPVGAEALCPVAYTRVVLRGLGCSTESVSRTTMLAQATFLCGTLPLAVWAGLCLANVEALQFKAMDDYARGPLPQGCHLVYSSFKHSDVYEVLAADRLDRIFINCSQTRKIVELALSHPDGIQRTLTTGVRFYGMALDPPSGDLFFYDNAKNRLRAVKVTDGGVPAERLSEPVFASYQEHVFVNVDSGAKRVQVFTFDTASTPSRCQMVEIDMVHMRKVREFLDLGPCMREFLFDAQRRRLYLSFDFKRGVKVLDVDSMRELATIDVNSHDGQMVLSPGTREILLADASRGLLIAYDADTFEYRRAIHVAGGVRSVAIDQAREIILADSVLTGTVYLLDLRTGRLLRSFGGLYPKFRCIRPVPGGGRALIGTWNFVYDLEY